MSGSLSSTGTTIMYQGDTFPLYNPQLLDENGDPIPLSGITASNLSLVLALIDAPHTAIEGNGRFTINDSAEGIITYAWDADDTATIGTYHRYVLISWPGSNPEHIGPDELVIAPVA